MCCLIIAVSGMFLRDIGEQVDSYKGVPVFNNGFFNSRTHGDHYHSCGYYCGIKWQCVEFINRFYKETRNHEMPDSRGDAKDYFDPELSNGSINEKLGMTQYCNGSVIKPLMDDIIVFMDPPYGHVAIVTNVTKDSLEVVQQNVFGRSRQMFDLETDQGRYFVIKPRTAEGWLRLERPLQASNYR